MPFLAQIRARIGATCLAECDGAEPWLPMHAGVSRGRISTADAVLEKGCRNVQFASRRPSLDFSLRRVSQVVL